MHSTIMLPAPEIGRPGESHHSCSMPFARGRAVAAAIGARPRVRVSPSNASRVNAGALLLANLAGSRKAFTFAQVRDVTLLDLHAGRDPDEKRVSDRFHAPEITTLQLPPPSNAQRGTSPPPRSLIVLWAGMVTTPVTLPQSPSTQTAGVTPAASLGHATID